MSKYEVHNPHKGRRGFHDEGGVLHMLDPGQATKSPVQLHADTVKLLEADDMNVRPAGDDDGSYTSTHAGDDPTPVPKAKPPIDTRSVAKPPATS